MYLDHNSHLEMFRANVSKIGNYHITMVSVHKINALRTRKLRTPESHSASCAAPPCWVNKSSPYKQKPTRIFKSIQAKTLVSHDMQLDHCHIRPRTKWHDLHALLAWPPIWELDMNCMPKSRKKYGKWLLVWGKEAGNSLEWWVIYLMYWGRQYIVSYN